MLTLPRLFTHSSQTPIGKYDRLLGKAFENRP
jgi:hypothetical protein